MLLQLSVIFLVRINHMLEVFSFYKKK